MSDSPRGAEQRRLLRSSMLNLGGGGVQVVAGLGVVLVLTRLFGSQAALGAFLTAVAGTNLVGRLSQLGTGTGIIRFVAPSDAVGDHDRTRRILVVGLLPALAMSLVYATIVWTQADRLAPLIADAEWIDTVAQYLRWFAPILPVVALLGAVANSTRAFGTMVPAALADNIMRPGLQFLGLGALLVVGASAPSMVAAGYWLPSALALVTVGLALAGMLRARPVQRAADRPSWGSLIRRYWAYTLPRSVSGVFATIIEWSDALLIAGLAGTGPAGLYAASSRIVLVGRTVQGAATHALRPQISRLLSAGDTAGAQATYHLAASWSMALTWPWFLGVALFAEDALRLLGPGFGAAAPAIRILSLAWLVGTAMGPVTAVLEMAGKSTWSMLDLGLAMVTNISLNLLLIPRLGITGAAVAWAASVAVNNALPAWQVHRVTGLRPFGRTARMVALVAVLPFLAVGLPVRLFAPQGLVTAAVTCVACGLVYLLALWRTVPEAQLGRLVQVVLRRRGRRGRG